MMIMFIIIFAIVHAVKSKTQGSGWTAGYNGTGYSPPPPPPPPPANTSRKDLERLRQYDPAFSLVVFDDFVSALYSEVLLARGASDPIMTLEHLRAHCPAALEIPGTGHNAHVESPAAIVALSERVASAAR